MTLLINMRAFTIYTYFSILLLQRGKKKHAYPTSAANTTRWGKPCVYTEEALQIVGKTALKASFSRTSGPGGSTVMSSGVHRRVNR
jgi:hypothetical protein